MINLKYIIQKQRKDKHIDFQWKQTGLLNEQATRANSNNLIELMTKIHVSVIRIPSLLSFDTNFERSS